MGDAELVSEVVVVKPVGEDRVKKRRRVQPGVSGAGLADMDVVGSGL